MFYKYEENNDKWVRGNMITLPNGDILSEDNKKEIDGWVWYDEEPQEYLDWKEEKELEHMKMMIEINK